MKKLAFVLALVFTGFARDYYDILGVSRDATKRQIKKAYRKRALKWHPDKQAKKDEKTKKRAEKRFAKLAQAYETLTDPKKKKIYDQFGEEGLKQSQQPGGPPPESQQGGGSWYNGQGQGFHGFQGFNMEDLYRTFGQTGQGKSGQGGFQYQDFGGGYPGGFGQGGRRGSPRPIYDYKSKACKVKRLRPRHFPDRSDIKYTWMVQFHDGSAESQDLSHTWKRLAKSLDGAIRVGAVDVRKYPELAERYNVEALPAVMLFKAGRGEHYDGVRSVKAFKEFASARMSKRVVNIRRAGQMDAFMAKDRRKPHVILFTDKYNTSILYKAMSWKYRSSIVFGEVRASNKAFDKMFKVRKYPTLYLVSRAGSKPKRYKGRIKLENIDRWLALQDGLYYIQS